MIMRVHLARLILVLIASLEAPTILGDQLRSSNEQDVQLRMNIEAVLKAEEDMFCSDIQAQDCGEQFKRGIKYRSAQLSPGGKSGLFVELHLKGFCGSGGCSLYVLRSEDNGYKIVLQSVGTLEDLKLLKTTTKGYFDLRQRGFYNDQQRNREYVWTGSSYKLKTDRTVDKARRD